MKKYTEFNQHVDNVPYQYFFEKTRVDVSDMYHVRVDAS